MTETDTQPGGLDEAQPDGKRFIESYLPFLLHRSYLLLSETFHAGLADVGLDVTECRIIIRLAEFGPSSLKQIQMQTNTAQPTASRACTRLSKKGLLDRRVGTVDKRQRVFELTEEGRAVSRRLMAVSSAALAETLGRTSVDPLRLSMILKHLIGDLEERRPGLTDPGSNSPRSQP